MDKEKLVQIFQTMSDEKIEKILKFVESLSQNPPVNGAQAATPPAQLVNGAQAATPPVQTLPVQSEQTTLTPIQTPTPAEQTTAQIQEQSAQGIVQTADQTIQTTEVSAVQNLPPVEQTAGTNTARIVGFKLVKKTMSSKGITYEKWYAVKGNDTIYVGSDPGAAKEKIQKWLSKRSGLKVKIQES